MPKTGEGEVLEVQAIEEAPREKRNEQEKPNAQEWIQRVEQKLFDEVVARQQGFQQDLGIKIGKDVLANPADLAGLDKGQIRALVEVLTLEDVESLLKALKDINPKEATLSVQKEIVLYEHQLQEVAVEKEATRRQVESVARVTNNSSLQQEVFENFAKFLGKDAEVRYAGNKLEVRMTADGKYIITVPEPTFENMIALAGQVSGKSQEIYGDTPEEFAQQLMDAALIMDQQAIFSPESIEAMYNAGYQLKKVFNKSLTDKHFTFEQIQREATSHLGGLSSKQRKDLMDKIYLGIFLGKHEAKFSKDDAGGLHIEGQGKLYDVLFERWQKSDEGKAWLQSHPDILKTLDNQTTINQITQAYDEWLSDPKRQYDMLHRLKKFVETKAIPGMETDRKYGVLLTQWRHMLLDSPLAKKISKDIGTKMSEDTSPEEQLRIICEAFQPGIKPDALQYLPSEVLELFQKEDADGKRNEAACIIADSYVKSMLQDRGFSVFTILQGKHTRLIAVNPKDGKAYYVDPSAPRGEAAVQEIQKQEKDILEQLREVNDQTIKIKRNISFRTKDGGVVADGNAILASGLLANMVEMRGKEMPDEAKFAAAQKAVQLFPENPIAWLRMAQTATDGKNEEYFQHARKLDPQNIPERLEDAMQEEMKIGDWRDTNGVPVGSTNPEIQRVIDQANDWIRMSRNPAGGLEALDASQLQTINAMLRQATGTINPLTNPEEYRDASQRLGDIGEEDNRRQREARGPTLFTPLLPETIEILERGTPKQIREVTEEAIFEVSRFINSGAYLDPVAKESIGEKLRPIKQYLDGRLTRNPRDKEIRREVEYVVNVTKFLEGLTNLDGLIESGDAKKLEQAVDYANQMDQQGGLIVYHIVSTIHEGRAVGLVSDLRREMKRTMQRNFQEEISARRPGRYYCTQEDYLRLPQTIIQQQIDMASRGIGPYAARFGKLNNPTDPRSGYTPKSLEIIREQITMDIKFAQLFFTATGEASAIYIQGRLPDNKHDAGAMQFMNAQWQNLYRYGEITDQNKAVAKLQFENACRIHLEGLNDEEAKNIILEMLKDKTLFDRYVEANALNLIAPQTNFWWENRYVRTLPMVWSLIGYEDGINPGSAARYGSKRVRDETEKKDIDAPVGGDPEFGILLRAFFYMGEGFYGKRGEDAFPLFQGKAADYFPDILIEPFSYQSAIGNTEKGISADRRFIQLFVSNASSFLGVRMVDESDYDLAIRRFNEFQTNYRPKMDAIRNKRINNPDRDPVQTNFSLNDTTPQSARADIVAAFGGTADAFQAFIGEMQGVIRGTGPGGKDGLAYALSYDPMFENQHYSPMSLIDVPMWMLDGDDLMTSNGRTGTVTEASRKNALRLQLGGVDRTGRHLRDALFLGEKTRAGLIQLVKNNPNNVEQLFKIVDEMAEGVTNTRGTPAAQELRIMAIGEYFKMMLPGPITDLLGLGSIHLFKNTEYRKIMGELINAYSREEIFSMVESKIMPGLSEDNRKRLRIILGITRKKRLRRSLYQTIFMLLLSTVLQTTGSVLGVLNEGVSKGAA